MARTTGRSSTGGENSSAARPGTRRADAQRSVDRILSATVDLLARFPEASMSDIAKAAGVGRVTLYSHFANRDVLVEASLVQVLAEGEEHLAALHLDGDPRVALRTLIESSWKLLAQAGAVLTAAQKVLPAGRLQRLHAKPEQRVQDLIVRGQDAGVFRTDQPMLWMTAVLHHLLHGAANDVADGRIRESEVARLVSETVLSAYAPPS